MVNSTTLTNPDDNELVLTSRILTLPTNMLCRISSNLLTVEQARGSYSLLWAVWVCAAGGG